MKAGHSKPLLTKKVNNRVTMGNNIIDLLVKGLNQTQIAKQLNVSKVTIHKHIKRLTAKGIVTEAPESNSKHKFYIVNHFLIGGENYDLHNIEIAFPISKMGSLPKGNIDMNNWKYAVLKFGDFAVKVVHGKRPNILIYPPKIYGETIEEVLIRCGQEVTKIAVMIEKHYDCSLDLKAMNIRRKPHLHALTDPMIKAMDRGDIQYNGENLEFNRSGDAHADILGFDAMRKYDQLLNDFDWVKQTLGSVARTQTQLFNTQALIGQTLDTLKSSFLALVDIVRAKPQETPDNRNLGQFCKPTEELRHLEIIDHTPAFVGVYEGILMDYPELYRGARIWISQDVAKALIKQGKAKEI
jgi:hypothetical protein